MMKVKLRQVKYLINLEAFFPSLMAQTVKHLPAIREIRVQSLGWGDPLEKKMATHSSILASRIPWDRKELDMTERFHFLFVPSACLTQKLKLV